MKILTALTYYRPHISGLTIYAERVCRALVQRGHQVTVLTSQYERSLPLREQQDGVEIFRVPVAWRISKGVIMPTIGWHATRLALQHDVIHLHLPQFDAAGIALRGRLFHHPVVLTYHSDLTLPPSLFHWLVERVVHLGNHAAVRLDDVVVTNTLDFAQNSPFLRRYPGKVQAILPPVEIPLPTPGAIEAFRDKFGIRQAGPLIGIVARLSAEKGIEYLLQALPAILERFPGASILHIGPREPVGEFAYAHRLAPLLEHCGDKYRHIGTVSNEELAAFYTVCDLHVLPSVNSTESFGMVLVEAALCGTLSVVTDLPGARMAIRQTGMGLCVPPRDAAALAAAVCEVIANRSRYVCPQAEVAQKFSSAAIAEQYEKVFERLIKEKLPI